MHCDYYHYDYCLKVVYVNYNLTVTAKLDLTYRKQFKHFHVGLKYKLLLFLNLNTHYFKI